MPEELTSLAFEPGIPKGQDHWKPKVSDVPKIFDFLAFQSCAVPDCATVALLVLETKEIHVLYKVYRNIFILGALLYITG